uniref:Uncharacterized protein n=1 Tax=Romanomermis culicivorax TaxID=13658 RepID=A0A915JE84_ROMCU
MAGAVGGNGAAGSTGTTSIDVDLSTVLYSGMSVSIWSVVVFVSSSIAACWMGVDSSISTQARDVSMWNSSLKMIRRRASRLQTYVPPSLAKDGSRSGMRFIQSMRRHPGLLSVQYHIQV